MSDYKNQVLQALRYCSQERLDAAMENPSMMKEILELFGHEIKFAYEFPNGNPGERAKRPLNAFMAFRTYYLKLFPDTQQKTASGFLTQLWAKDPHRNKWALVAKVYSFIRDHVGKAGINLSAFLSVACPMMKILEPIDYLRTLGWQIGHDSYGVVVLTQDVAVMSENLGMLQDIEHPTTEIDLLTDVLTAGYFTEYSQHLQIRLWTTQNGIMTPSGPFAGDAFDTVKKPFYEPVPATSEKVDFVNSVRENACQAAQDLFGPEYEAEFFQNRFVHSWEVEDLASFQDVQISIADEPMASNTLYDFNQLPESIPQVAELAIDTSIDAGIMEVTSAWSLDKIMIDRVNRERHALETANKATDGGFFANF